jgi:hypothetical protein
MLPRPPEYPGCLEIGSCPPACFRRPAGLACGPWFPRACRRSDPGCDATFERKPPSAQISATEVAMLRSIRIAFPAPRSMPAVRARTVEGLAATATSTMSAVSTSPHAVCIDTPPLLTHNALDRLPRYHPHAFGLKLSFDPPGQIRAQFRQHLGLHPGGVGLPAGPCCFDGSAAASSPCAGPCAKANWGRAFPGPAANTCFSGEVSAGPWLSCPAGSP